MFNSQFEIHRIKGIDTSISYIMTWNKAMRNPGTKLFLKEASKVNVDGCLRVITIVFAYNLCNFYLIVHIYNK